MELIPLSRFIPSSQGWNGRPPHDRNAIARAFVAKPPRESPRFCFQSLRRDGGAMLKNAPTEQMQVDDNYP